MQFDVHRIRRPGCGKRSFDPAERPFEPGRPWFNEPHMFRCLAIRPPTTSRTVACHGLLRLGAAHRRPYMIDATLAQHEWEKVFHDARTKIPHVTIARVRQLPSYVCLAVRNHIRLREIFKRVADFFQPTARRDGGPTSRSLALG